MNSVKSVSDPGLDLICQAGTVEPNSKTKSIIHSSVPLVDSKRLVNMQLFEIIDNESLDEDEEEKDGVGASRFG